MNQPDTNPDAVKLLSDDEVARLLALSQQNAGPSFGYTHDLCRAVDALCATVRVLRKALRDYGEHESHCKSKERYPSPDCDCVLAQYLGASTNESPQP